MKEKVISDVISQKHYPRSILYGELGEAIFRFYAYHKHWWYVSSVFFINTLIGYRRNLQRYGNLNKWKPDNETRSFVEGLKSYHEFFWQNCVRPPRSGNPDLRYWVPKKGLPDYLVCKWTPKAVYFFVEVKTEKSKLSKIQKELFKILAEHFSIYIFTADLPEDLEIKIQLEKL